MLHLLNIFIQFRVFCTIFLPFGMSQGLMFLHQKADLGKDKNESAKWTWLNYPGIVRMRDKNPS